MKTLIIFLLVITSITLSQQEERIEVSSISEKELEKLIDSRDGKLLLINIWATWCVPCRKEFPDLVKLSEHYKGEVDVIAISVDYADEVEKKVIPFLNKNNVKFPVYISGFDNDEDIINFFSKDWNGALPASIIYDRNGNKIKLLEGKHSFESFSSSIEKIKSGL